MAAWFRLVHARIIRGERCRLSPKEAGRAPAALLGGGEPRRYIAGPNGDFDWITVDPEIDFAEMYAGFSGLVMGRRSYEVYVSTGGGEGLPLPVYVYTRSLPEGERDGVTFVRDVATHVQTLKRAAAASAGAAS